jgi:hypothetical protein
VHIVWIQIMCALCSAMYQGSSDIPLSLDLAGVGGGGGRQGTIQTVVSPPSFAHNSAALHAYHRRTGSYPL